MWPRRDDATEVKPFPVLLLLLLSKCDCRVDVEIRDDDSAMRTN